MQNSSSITTDEPVNITLTDRLFDALQQAIVEGEIPQGSKISELSWRAGTGSAAARCGRPSHAWRRAS